MPLALRPKQSAPPATISKHAVSQKAGIFSPIESVASQKNTTMLSIRLIFICVLGGLRSLCMQDMSPAVVKKKILAVTVSNA